MEGAPFIPEYQNDDIERREKKLPKAETIGSLIVEANPEKNPDSRQQSPEHLGHALLSKETLQDQSEADFEKDPVLRHKQHSNAASRLSSSIGSLIRDKDVSLDAKNLQSTTHDDSAQNTKSASAGHHWSIADLVMFSVISILVLLIILVIILRG